MSEGSVCKFNQRGYCKFKESCRKKNEKEKCQNEDTCSSKECPYRHPQVCRYFSKETLCRFGEDCAYKHKPEIKSSSHAKLILKKKEKEINAIQDEMRKLNNKCFHHQHHGCNIFWYYSCIFIYLQLVFV